MRPNSSSYEHELDRFEDLVSASLSISYHSGGINTSANGIIATKIYTRLAVMLHTLTWIAPGNRLNGNNHWDVPSIATIIRTFFETKHRYFYMAETGISEASSEFRRALYYYHLNFEKYQILKEIGEDQATLDEFDRKLPTEKEWIVNHPIFISLSKNSASKIRSGTVNMHISDAEMAERFAKVSNYTVVYRILSAHSHGNPFATNFQSNDRGCGFGSETEEYYLIIFLTFTSKYVARIILEQAKLLHLEKICSTEVELAEKHLGTQPP